MLRRIGRPPRLYAPADDAGAAAAAAAAGSTGAGAGGAGAAGGAGGAGAGGDPWYVSPDLKLDDDTRKWAEGKQFPDIATALRSGRESDTVARSRNVFEKPDPKNPDAWKGWSELGWVEDPAKYTLKRPEIRDGVEYDGGLEDHLRTIAHEKRVPLPAAQALLDGMVAYQHKLVDQVTAKGAADEKTMNDALHVEWGDKFDEKKEIAKRAAETLGLKVGDAGVLEKITGAAGLLKMFAQVGELMTEQKLGGGGGGGGGALTPASAEAELNRLQTDKDFMAAFRDERHDRHKDVVAQRDRLLAIIAQAPPAT